MIVKLKRIYKNSRLTTKTKLKHVTGRHLQFWDEGINSEGWRILG